MLRQTGVRKKKNLLPVKIKYKGADSGGCPICGHSSVGIEGSNHAQGSVLRPFCLLCCEGSGPYDELITGPEGSYRVCVCVCVCLIVCDL